MELFIREAGFFRCGNVSVANKPVAKDAADGLLAGEVAILGGKAINSAKIGLLDSEDNPVTFDGRPTTRFLGHINY